MGKHGPCYHCGVTSTPLWRNGPSEKPVLCNACGSRWRTKGTLANYTPLHSRADPDEYEDHRATRMKTISVSKSKEEKVLKRKQNYDTGFVGGFLPDYNQGLQKGLDEDTSNRSSSGSAISNPESCALFGSSADGSDMTGQAQSIVWESMIPSRKRTCVTRQKSSSVEKLTKDLYAILHEQQSSSLSECSEEDLLFESDTPMVSVEIGHGSVLFRHPSSIARDEESEASSLSVENKQCLVSEAYSHSLTIQQKKAETVIVPGAELNNPIWGGTYAEHLMRDKYLNERIDVMGNPHSLLCNIDLSASFLLLVQFSLWIFVFSGFIMNIASVLFVYLLVVQDVLTFKEFGNLTIPEQQRLLQYLPPSDAAKLPGSVKVLFESPQFKDDISSYQQLLAEGQAGAFDLSFAGAKAEDSDAPKRLELSNLWKSKWVEHYNLLKNCRSVGRFPLGRGMSGVASTNLVSAKRLRDSDTQKVPDARTMKSPRRIIIKGTTDNKEHLDSESSLFSPRSLFALPPDSSSMMLDSLPCADENPDQDLLLDIPSNGSFAQAELLHPTKSSPQASASSSLVYPRPFHPYL